MDQRKVVEELYKKIEKKVEEVLKSAEDAMDGIGQSFIEAKEKLRSREHDEIEVLIREYDKANASKSPEERADADKALEEGKKEISKRYAEKRKKLDEEKNAVANELEEATNKATGQVVKVLVEIMELNLEDSVSQRRVVDEFAKMMMADLHIEWDREERKLSFRRSLFNGAPALGAVRVVAVLIHEANISWDCDMANTRDEDRHRVRYTVEMKRSADNEHCWKEVYSGAETGFTAKGLEKDTEYNVRVRYVVEDIQGEWGGVVNLRTKDIPVPSNFVVKGVTYDAITVAWNPVPSDPREPISFHLVVDGRNVLVGNTTTYTHSNLSPDTQHSYRVCAVCGNSVSNWSSEVYGKTNSISVPALRNRGATCTSITVAWNPVPGATSYGMEVDGRVVSAGNTTTYTHSNLSPDTQHRYRVRAVCGNSVSNWSNPASYRTNSMPIPAFQNERVTCTTITLSWNPVPGATSYGMEVDGRDVLVGNTTTYIHSNLSSNTPHKYRVCAVCENSVGEWSSPVEVRTPPRPNSGGGGKNHHARNRNAAIGGAVTTVALVVTPCIIS